MWDVAIQIHVREIDQGWIYGPYVCRAKNGLGEVEKTINLYRAGKTCYDLLFKLQSFCVFSTFLTKFMIVDIFALQTIYIVMY